MADSGRDDTVAVRSPEEKGATSSIECKAFDPSYSLT